MPARVLTDRPPGLKRGPGGAGPHRAEYDEAEVHDIIALLHEHPALYSPRAFAKQHSAHTAARRLADRLLAYGVEVEIMTFRDTHAPGRRYRWCLGLVTG
jgi:hypothetical protein